MIVGTIHSAKSHYKTTKVELEGATLSKKKSVLAAQQTTTREGEKGVLKRRRGGRFSRRFQSRRRNWNKKGWTVSSKIVQVTIEAADLRKLSDSFLKLFLAY